MDGSTANGLLVDFNGPQQMAMLKACPARIVQRMAYGTGVVVVVVVSLDSRSNQETGYQPLEARIEQSLFMFFPIIRSE